MMNLIRLSAEYLDKDELEQNVQVNNDLRGQKEALETEIAAYQKKDCGIHKRNP